jgi:NAD(P)-dependent dehydrogenase (short-subunit alcohol dehydrogenase family)
VKDIDEKLAVVTGAGSGIGQATALALAGAGAAVAVCDLDRAAAGRTADRIQDLGGRASAHQVDVSSEVEMRALVDAVMSEHGVADIVVNNAGIMSDIAAAAEVPLSQFRRVMEVNFWGVVHGSLLFLPHLLGRPSAHIVNVSSNAGLVAYARMAPYNSSKFAVRGFTETLRMELQGTPVGVTAVFPGSTKTSLLSSPVVDDERRRSLQAWSESNWGRSPEAVADAIVRAIRKDRARALSGLDSTLLDLIVRVAPGSYSRLLARPINTFFARAAAKR